MKLTPKQQQAVSNIQSYGKVGVIKDDTLHKMYLALVSKGALKIVEQSSLHTWFDAV